MTKPSAEVLIERDLCVSIITAGALFVAYALTLIAWVS